MFVSARTACSTPSLRWETHFSGSAAVAGRSAASSRASTAGAIVRVLIVIPPGGRSARRSALPAHVPHEEGTERLEVLRGLGGLAHRLHEVRQRVQLAADQADHAVVVV